MHHHPHHRWTLPLAAVSGILAAVAAVLADRSHVLPHAPWAWPLIGAAAALLHAIVIAMREPGCTPTGRVGVTAASWVCGGAWVTWASAWRPTPAMPCALVAGGLVLLAVGYLTTPAAAGAGMRGGDLGGECAVTRDVRPPLVRQWEALLRAVAGKPLRVTGVEPWADRSAGYDVHVSLPIKMVAADLAALTDALATACQLPTDCRIWIGPAANRGSVILRVMLRNALADGYLVNDDSEAASINDPFPLVRAPAGEDLDVCLRLHSMVIGGAPNGGKTTLLHRIIMQLARCVDALIWVVDLNGGGVALPWLTPWVLGEAGAPVVDWVANSEAEAAAMLAVARAVAKDRKAATGSVRRRRAANSTILPVDQDLPAIIILTDEGAEVRQAANLLGQLAQQGISRVAQIGRAEGVRVIMSVIKGTSDMLDRGMKICAPLRVCLKMDEPEEYAHVLGVHPGSEHLGEHGYAYLRRANDPRPLYGRTAMVELSDIETQAIATWELRPSLDKRGRRVAARLTPSEVLEGREVPPEIAALSVMRDVAAGRAYEGRWERQSEMLAQLRAADLASDDDEDDDEPVATAAAAGSPLSTPALPPPAAPTVGGPAFAALMRGTGVPPSTPTRDVTPVASEADRWAADLDSITTLDDIDWGDAERENAPGVTTVATQPRPQTTAREHIRAILAEARGSGLSSDEIGKRMAARMGKEVARTYRQGLLKAMREAGEIVQSGDGAPYRLAQPWG